MVEIPILPGDNCQGLPREGPSSGKAEFTGLAVYFELDELRSPGEAVYAAASKAEVEPFTHREAKRLGSRGSAVTAVAP